MRPSGPSPTCHAPVPAESTWISVLSPASLTMSRKIPSAAGERQMFPRQTNNTFFFIGSSLLALVFGGEFQRGGVDAIALAGRLRAVGKYVSQMGAAILAHD